MVLTKGEKVLIVLRRKFEKDLRRHFIGEITEASETVIRVYGYTFIFDENTKEFMRRRKPQTNIFSLIDALIVVIVLPKEIDVEEIKYSLSEKGHRIITDGKKFSFRISEFGVFV